MDKLNKYTEMENVKEILIEFKEYFNNLNDTFITESNINRFIMQSKYRPREPEAINRNEQAKEFKSIADLKDGESFLAKVTKRKFNPNIDIDLND